MVTYNNTLMDTNRRARRSRANKRVIILLWPLKPNTERDVKMRFHGLVMLIFSWAIYFVA
jgi:hypothetical protein